MRLLRELDQEDTAQALVDALSDQGIAAQASENRDGRFAVWVIDEENLPKASELADRWLDPADPQLLQQTARRGRAARELAERLEERRQRQIEAVTRQMLALQRPRPTPLTWGLIGLCVAVGILTRLGDERSMIEALTIADPRGGILARAFSLGGQQLVWLELPWDEPWRLVTPVILHFGLIHIIFNLLWLRELGRIVELTHGARYLAAFVIVCGAVSNIAQYEIAQSPMFGGMSGVVYALLGMIWLRGRIDPRASYRLSTSTVQFMLIWLALGFVSSWFGDPSFSIANWCHLFGLLSGVAWAYVATRASHRRSP